MESKFVLDMLELLDGVKLVLVNVIGCIVYVYYDLEVMLFNEMVNIFNKVYLGVSIMEIGFYCL